MAALPDAIRRAVLAIVTSATASPTGAPQAALDDTLPPAYESLPTASPRRQV